MKIIFRADGNSNTGLGHLYRLFSLVEIVKTSYEFAFVTKGSSTQDVVPSGYKKIVIPDSVIIEDEPNWLANNFEPLDHIIIADGYQFVSSYQKSIKEKGFKLIYVDDLAEQHMYADIVINHSTFIEKADYKKEDNTYLALGPKYALLRPSFIETARDKRMITNIDSAFICFGGADPFDLSIKALKSLLEFKEFKKISVVLGSAYKHKDIYEFVKNSSSNIYIYQNLSEIDLLEVMKDCKFAIVPASTILYEICCVKMVTLSGYFIDNQERIYNVR